MLLALDTATDAVTVALHDGTRVIGELSAEDRLRHGETLAPAIDSVLSAAGVTPGCLTSIAVGVGPGPYTGLRIGLVTATTMGATLRIPVVGIGTLDAIAAGVDVGGPFVVATDARRKEVFWARYSSPLVRESDPAVGFPASVATDLPVAGNGPALYPEAFPHPIAPRLPSATDLALLVVSGGARTLPAVPIYLRRPDAVVPSAPKRVR